MITVQIATIPERVELLKQAVASIYNQVHKINIMLNCYDHTPSFGAKVNCIHRNNELTDAEKYYNVEYLEGYIFTCDDDLIYPPDYVSYMISKIEQYKRTAAVSFHGSIFSQSRPFESYYGSRLWSFRCLESQEMDTEVDVIGNGCAAYHTDTLKLSYSDFKLKDCSDLQFSLIAKKKGVKRIVVAHEPLGYLKPELHGGTIWERQYGNDEKQVELLNKHWN